MDTHCICRTRKEDIKAYIERNQGLVVIYGAAFWGILLAQNNDFKVDCFCDRRASELHSINGIPVIDTSELEDKIDESGKRATIIVCVETRGTATGIYKDLMRVDLNADVFDYFENELVFCDLDFSLSGKNYRLFEHSYNCGYTCGRMTERSVELALAEEYINNCSAEIVEIGAVTPYYFYDEKISVVIDPTDIHRRVTKKSLFDCDLTNKNVLSISTVEHIGTSDYEMHEEKNAVEAIQKIVEESASCLITAPLGYNKLLDEWVKKNQSSSMVKLLQRKLNNHWTEITEYDSTIEYTRLWANGLVIIEK